MSYFSQSPKVLDQNSLHAFRNEEVAAWKSLLVQMLPETIPFEV